MAFSGDGFMQAQLIAPEILVAEAGGGCEAGGGLALSSTRLTVREIATMANATVETMAKASLTVSRVVGPKGSIYIGRS